MTEEDERELFRRLSKIDRRLQFIGGSIIAGFCVFAIDRIYKQAEPDWGSTLGYLMAAAVAIGLGAYFVRRFDRG